MLRNLIDHLSVPEEFLHYMQLLLSKRKTGDGLYVLAIIGLLFTEIWFLALFTPVNPNSLPYLDISKPLPDKTLDNITYQIEIQNTVIVVHEAQDEKSSIIDVTGIITSLVVNLVVLIIGIYLRKKFLP